MQQANYKVGIVGHRYLGEADTANYVRYCCFKLLSEFKAKHANLTAVSAASEGADTIFAGVALNLKIKLITISPFRHFSDDFSSESGLEMFSTIRGRSSQSECMNFSKRSMSAYKKSMEWVVIKSHSLIGVWDGRPSKLPGGTFCTIEFARSIGRPVFLINPQERTLGYFGSINFGRSKAHRLEMDVVGDFI